MESVCEKEISELVKENAVAKPPLPSPGRTDKSLAKAERRDI